MEQIKVYFNPHNPVSLVQAVILRQQANISPNESTDNHVINDVVFVKVPGYFTTSDDVCNDTTINLVNVSLPVTDVVKSKYKTTSGEIVEFGCFEDPYMGNLITLLHYAKNYSMLGEICFDSRCYLLDFIRNYEDFLYTEDIRRLQPMVTDECIETIRLGDKFQKISNDPRYASAMRTIQSVRNELSQKITHRYYAAGASSVISNIELWAIPTINIDSSKAYEAIKAISSTYDAIITYEDFSNTRLWRVFQRETGRDIVDLLCKCLGTKDIISIYKENGMTCVVSHNTKLVTSGSITNKTTSSF